MDANALTFGDIVLRLTTAVLIGGVIGLNRDLHHKNAGLRTFGLVALATSGLSVGTELALSDHPDNIGRVIQGVLTGIGFLGAGVIMHRPDGGRVTGLTTAAAVWFVAAASVLCGLGHFMLVGLLVAFGLALLIGGIPLERLVERLLARDDGATRRDEDD